MGASEDKPNYWGIRPSDIDPCRFVLKHKPRFVTGEDGKTHVEIHPEDAHLFDNAAPKEER